MDHYPGVGNTSSAMTVGKEAFGPDDVEKVAMFSRCRSPAVPASGVGSVVSNRVSHHGSPTHRAMWLAHTSVPDPDRVGGIQRRLATDGTSGLWFIESSPTANIFFLLLLGYCHQSGKERFASQLSAGLLQALPRLDHDNSDALASRVRYCLFGA